MAAKTCVICGKPSSFYTFCKECNDAKNEGLIVKCPECGAWHHKNKPCKCAPQSPQPQANPFTEKSTTSAVDDEADDLEGTSIRLQYETYIGNCLFCGKATTGKLFCANCYHEYKGKAVVIKIKHCEETEMMAADYESDLRCTDGHIVKSKCEKFIDEYLTNHNIKHAYEATKYIGGIKMNPDFCIKKEDGSEVFIEHFGLDTPAYTKNAKRKIERYKMDKKTLICTYEDDMKDFEVTFEYKLQNYKVGEINFEE